MIMHEIEIQLPGFGYKASNPGEWFWDSPLKTLQLFWKLELKGNWFIDLELKLKVALFWHSGGWSIFITAEKTEAQVEKYAHIFCSPSKMKSALTGTGHVYTVDGGKLNKSRALKH